MEPNKKETDVAQGKARIMYFGDELAVTGCVERFIVSPSSYVLVIGWLADEGYGFPAFSVLDADHRFFFPAASTYRYKNTEVESAIRPGAYDYGFVVFSKIEIALRDTVTFEVENARSKNSILLTVERMSDKRMLDSQLDMIASFKAHADRDIVLNSFMNGTGGDGLISLFQTHVSASLAGCYVERFRPRPVQRSFITVLFGSAEPILLQPVLFRRAGIDFGEWIYVCNSPEKASEALRLGRLISELYDLSITIVTMGDNVGFGAANNAAVTIAASDTIFLINPDVFAMTAHADTFRQVMMKDLFGTSLWGGLLFYDDDNLMHSGMYVETDTFVRQNSFNSLEATTTQSVCRLLRVEHFDKGVPFYPKDWTKARSVTAITGAMMVFKRPIFEKLDGFSTQYIYGHYEDADLSLRWAQAGHGVMIHPQLRLVHLEGQGSKSTGTQYRGAAIANRHIFTKRHGEPSRNANAARTEIKR